MPKYTLEAAKSVITETDNNRIICIWLSCELTAVEWARAAEKYGSISTDSFKTMNKRLLKKIKAASSETSGATTTIPTTAKITKPKPKPTHKKRKIEEGSESDDSGFKFIRTGRKVGRREQTVEAASTIVDAMDEMNTDDDVDSDAV